MPPVNKLAFILFTALQFSMFCRGQDAKKMTRFAGQLDTIRQELKIPGMAIAVMKDDSLFFAKGFGWADVKNGVKATANTCFRVASVTKTFTSTLVMQLVEKGKLDLQTPIIHYGLDFGNKNITVKNLLTHTSEGKPGSFYQYNGFRFGRLGPVIEQVSGKPFYELLTSEILLPLGMTRSAPGISLFEYYPYLRQHPEVRPYFDTAFTNLAKPYELDASGRMVETSYLNEFGAFGGLITNVTDLLKYSRAIDRHRFISAAAQATVFTPNRTNAGQVTPYGLGWFTQNYKGVDFYWHYGQTQGESALFVKVPSRKLCFVAMANCDKLSQPFQLGDGDLFTSPLGQLFYRYFIDVTGQLLPLDDTLPIEKMQEVLSKDTMLDFYNKEIVTQFILSQINGYSGKRTRLLKLYAGLNFKNKQMPPQGTMIAALRDVSINQDLTQAFTIATTMQVNLYGVGENCSGDLSSWCDYGWIEDKDGKIIWQMQGQPAKHAGGAIKNQLVEQVITLQPGNYKLRYKSDAGHAFDNWDSAPPDNYFWGILLFKH